MTDLCKPDGDRPEWPLLMQWMLQEQLAKEQAVERTYDGKRILIPAMTMIIGKQPERNVLPMVFI